MDRIILDCRGNIWRGPIKNESNFNYAKFRFFNIFGDPVWILSRSSAPENQIELLPFQEELLRENIVVKNRIETEDEYG
jgi:hypothetical protein